MTHCSLSMFRYTLLINILYHFTVCKHKFVGSWIIIIHFCKICVSFLQQQRRKWRKKNVFCLLPCLAWPYLIRKSSSQSENIYSILTERLQRIFSCLLRQLRVFFSCSSIKFYSQWAHKQLYVQFFIEISRPSVINYHFMILFFVSFFFIHY